MPASTVSLSERTKASVTGGGSDGRPHCALLTSASLQPHPNLRGITADFDVRRGSSCYWAGVQVSPLHVQYGEYHGGQISVSSGL